MVGLVASGPVVETFVLGKMAFEGPDMRRVTIFRIASMTKPVTATAVKMLVEEGKLRLDEPVDRLLPDLANRGGSSPPDHPTYLGSSVARALV